MIYSMTGFGRANTEVDQSQLTIEMKSVNHRYFDVSLSVPPHLQYLEDRFNKIIRRYIKRGKIYLYINNQGTPMATRQIETDWELVGQYFNQLQKISDAYDINDKVTLDHLLNIPDIFKINERVLDDERLERKLLQALEEAVEKLVDMRRIEGEHIKYDFVEKLEDTETKVEHLHKLTPAVVDHYRSRLEKRMRELLTDEYQIDEDRLLNEVAVFADKVNIDEEITRLSSHIKQFFDIMDENEPKGRKLDFLIQEMNREVNTIGSKGNDAAVSQHVVEIKSNIEKLREQVQNVE